MDEQIDIFLYLYDDLNNKQSRYILQLIYKVHLNNIITPIQVNEKIKYLISNNTKNLIISKLPAFVILYKNNKSRIYYSNDIDDVLELAHKIKYDMD